MSKCKEMWFSSLFPNVREAKIEIFQPTLIYMDGGLTPIVGAALPLGLSAKSCHFWPGFFFSNLTGKKPE